MIKEIICCVAGTFFFAIIMNAPRFCLIYITIGAMITATIERLLTGFYGELLSCMIAMICLSFFSEIAARSLKIPASVILKPSTIPLLPGSSIYYTMFYGISQNSRLFIEYGKSTIYTGLGIALGAIISSIIIRLINQKNAK